MTEAQFPERYGPFTLVRELGAGGMGTVYLALHPDTDNLLVLKRMHPQLLQDASILKRFTHEAEVAAHVRHPNVAAVVAMGTVDKEPFFTTEFVFGLQLSKIVDRIEQSLTGPVPLGVGLHLSVELARGVEAIHEARHQDTGAPLALIHRDIGARNVLVGFDGRLRIIDLGLGKSILSDWQTAHQLLAGSPDYMPPEQAMGARVDARADVYAAAVTIWELLAGKKRIREESIAARITRAVGAQPEPLLVHRPDGSVRLESILKHAMHPDPDRRTPTATMLRKTLEEELASAAKGTTAQQVIEWLDVACATVIAKERRLVEEAVAAGRHRQGPVRAKTEFFFGEREGKLTLPKAYAYYDQAHVPPALKKRMSQELLAPAQEALIDARAFRRAPLSVKAGLIGLAVVVPTILAVATAWWLRSRGPEVAPLPVEPSTPDAAIAVEPPIQEDPELVPPPLQVDPPDVGTAMAVNDPDDEPRRLSPEVAARKEALVARLRLLRKRKFEVSWQRKLTTLGTRLSRAKSARELEEIEAALRRMEREL